MDSTPFHQCCTVLPELLNAQRFPGQEAAHLLPSILKIGVTLKEDEFREKVAPLVVKLFASPDRAVRFRLLTSLGEMIEFLATRVLGGDREVLGSVRRPFDRERQSMIFFVARLKPKTVENRVLKLLIKMMQDSEASIRTNALICVGRVSSHLPAASVSPTLMTVVGMGLKDPFTPCRCAALQTLSATSSCLSPEELAQKLLPGVCHRLIDPDQAVADMAFSTLSKLQDVVRQKMAERREAAQEAPQSEQLPKEDHSGWATSAGSFFGMDKVRQKLMGVAGSMTTEKSVAATSPNEANHESFPPTAPEQPGPPRAGMRLESSSSGGGARARSKETNPHQGGGGALDLDMEFDDVGGAWDEDPLGSKEPDVQVQDASDFGDDFFEQFDSQRASSKGAPPPAQAAAVASSAPSRPKAPAPAAPKATMPKAKSEPAKKLDDIDDDFWKEFDM
ncbi:unnamed protein product [Durusdinium trenchii]|uniref:Uncharacterized protein n=1 Tax=Durusdinium trenchii TaxID=1381693 RepID=A0ABP0IRJ0_9DINO